MGNLDLLNKIEKMKGLLDEQLEEKKVSFRNNVLTSKGYGVSKNMIYRIVKVESIEDTEIKNFVISTIDEVYDA